MRPFAVLLVLCLPLVAGESQLMYEDPGGDVTIESYGNEAAAAGNWDPVDMRSLHIEETPDYIVFTVAIQDMPTCEGGQCPNGGDLRTYFNYGMEGYYVQQGIDPLGNAYGRLSTVPIGEIDGRNIGGNMNAVKDIAGKAVIVEIPRALLVDESGTPPLRNRSLENMVSRSFSQASFGGPEVAGSTNSFVVKDEMGFATPQTFTFQMGGTRSKGPIALASEAPFRASNGGSALYEFTLNLTNESGATTDYIISTEGLPSDWLFDVLQPITIEAGATQSVPILLETLSGHQHGGTEQFTVLVEDLDDLNTWARMELGVHYVSVPQPAGHHPTLFLHTLTDGTAATAITVFGRDDGRIWMNALEEDPGDEGVPIVAQGGAQGVAGQSAAWSICLIPNLRLGLDMDLSRVGEIQITLGSTSPYVGLQVSGRLIHIAGPEPLNFCDPQMWRERETVEIATISTSDSQDLANSVATFDMTVTPSPAGDYIEYQQGAQLVLELVATYQGGSVGPTGLSMHPGGKMTLPLNEYRDARPPGFLGGSAQTAQADANATEIDVVAEPKDSPAAGLVLPLVLALLLVARRRAR